MSYILLLAFLFQRYHFQNSLLISSYQIPYSILIRIEQFVTYLFLY